MSRYKITLYCHECDENIEELLNVKEKDITRLVTGLLDLYVLSFHNVHTQINIVNMELKNVKT